MFCYVKIIVLFEIHFATNDIAYVILVLTTKHINVGFNIVKIVS